MNGMSERGSDDCWGRAPLYFARPLPFVFKKYWDIVAFERC